MGISKALPALVFTAALLPSAPAKAQDAKAAFAMGVQQLKENKTAEAIRSFETATRLDPKFADAHLRLGNTLLGQKRLERAVKSFQAALAIKPELQDARYNLAWALRQTNAHSKAAEQYRLFLQRTPDDADALYGLADALDKSKQTAAAAEAYESYAKAEKRPAHAKWRQKALEKAKALRAMAKTSPAPVASPAPTPVAKTMTAPGKAAPAPKAGQPTPTAGASKPMKVAVADSSRPKSFDAGIGHLQTGDYQTALERLNSAVNQAPNDALVLAALASAHLGLKNGPAAAAGYRRALGLADSAAQPGIYLGLGEAHRLQGDFKAAINAYQMAMKHESATNSIKRMSEERIAALSEEG